MNTSIAFKSPIASTATGLVKAVRDPLINGDNGGIRFIADLAFGFCYPGGDPGSRPATPPDPVNGATIYDVAERTNGSVEIASADTGHVSYDGGGFDFSGITSRGNGIVIPSAAFADIWTPVNDESQSFLTCVYVKLPTLANFPPSGSCWFLQWANQTGIAYPFDLQLNSSGQIGARRRGAGANEGAFITPNSADYGTVVQIAVWRLMGGHITLRYKGANGSATATGTVTTEGDTDPSSVTGEFGTTSAGWALNSPARTGFRIYRIWIDNLARDSRNPATILDADYARVIARNAFS